MDKRQVTVIQYVERTTVVHEGVRTQMIGIGARNLPGWTHVYSGKVRDVYVPSGVDAHNGEDTYLIVASDRISAYDYVLPTEIPDKGRILTQLSLWWFEQLADLTPNHVMSTNVPAAVEGRAMITRRLKVFPVECVVRGYLTGSGMAEYKRRGTVCGVALPPGIREAERLDRPIFTPTTKARLGDHDQSITFADTAARVGEGVARELRAKSIATYARAREIAAERGIIIADTKFEFGVEPDTGRIVLAEAVRACSGCSPRLSRSSPAVARAPSCWIRTVPRGGSDLTGTGGLRKVRGVCASRPHRRVAGALGRLTGSVA